MWRVLFYAMIKTRNKVYFQSIFPKEKYQFQEKVNYNYRTTDFKREGSFPQN